MTFGNLSQTVTKEGETFNLQVSKNIHHQGETFFCWAFAISSMLRNSLLRCGKCDSELIQDINFHRRLRNEIIMGPIPKPKYFDFKDSTTQRKTEIIAAQGHIVTAAIQRLVFPTIVDPPGLQMLQSIRNVIDIDNVKYKIEEYANAKDLVHAIQDGKCPVVVGQNKKESLFHAMVAYSVSKIGDNQYVKCKNSYGQDPSQPDIVEIPLDGTANNDGWSLFQPMEAIYIKFT